MSESAIDIVDLRAKHHSPDGPADASLRDQILHGLLAPPGQKSLPTMLLYDERGLRLYDAITTDAPEYYLFPAEEEILRLHGDDIAHYMHAAQGANIANETVIELGAG